MFSRAIIVGFVLIAGLLQPMPATAQPKCSIEHFSTANGLSDNRIMYIMKDREGFMWMGTWTGINRFDGHNFVTYKSYPGDQSELKNNRIDVVVEDRAGFLWLKAYDRQVYRFDKKTEQFLSIAKFMQPENKLPVNIDKIIPLRTGQVALTTKDRGFFIVSAAGSDKPVCKWFSRTDAVYKLPSDSITCFYESATSDIWVGSRHGLICLRAQGDSIYKKANLPDQLANAGVTCVAESQANVWFGTKDGELLCLDKKSGRVVTLNVSVGRINGVHVSHNGRNIYLSTSRGEVISVDPQSFTISSASIFSNNELFSIYEDRNGLLWIEPKEKGIVLFDPAAKSFQLFTQPSYANYLHDADEYLVVEDNKGTVWLNMKGCGFGYFDPASKSVKYLFNEPGVANTRFTNMVSAEFFDPTGILWLSTDAGGLEKIIFQPNDFTQVRVDSNTFLKADNDVRGLYTDSKGRLWAATKSTKLYVLADGKKLDNLFSPAPHPLAGIYVILEDKKGNIWMGSKGDGIFKAEPLNDKREHYTVKHFLSDPKDPYSLSNNMIYSILEDKLGRIWVGTFGGGINLINETETGIQFYHHKNKFRMYPTDVCNKIRHIASDIDGRIWIGTTEGLLVFDPNSNNFFNSDFVRYGKIPGNIESLGDNDVQFVYRDKDNSMWALTSSGGLNKAIGTQPMQALRFRNYSKKDGLPSDYLLSCIEDRQGYMWIATQNGLSRFNTAANVFRNFDAADGLPQQAFAEASCTSTKNGELIFGTLNGYLHFNPSTIVNPVIKADIAFTNLQVNSEDVSPGEKKSPLKYTINNTNEITLAYNQNILNIDYTILDYRSEGKESYAYRLLGFDSAWHNNKAARRASYTNLPPGRYTFQVKSTSADIYSNTPMKSLAITILPPPWKTWWAYLIYGVLAVLLLAIVRKNALTKLRLRQRITIERKLADLKLNFFTNISHELRTPLTLILNPLEEISREEKLSAQGSRHLMLVRKNAQRLNRFINQLLDLRKAESGKSSLTVSRVELVSFIKKISGYFTDVAHQKKIVLSIEPQADQIFCWMDAEKIDIVIYNVLANAFKFTPDEKNIRIAIYNSVANNNVIIEVIDEGSGVPAHQLDDIFGLYFEGHQSDTHTVKGTGIGLALSKELVQLHHGQISARNNVPNGLVVKIQLQPGKTHFAQDQVVFTDTVPDFEKSLIGELIPEDDGEAIEDVVAETTDLPLLLLVEDNSDLRSFLKNQLSSLYRVETAENGEEGLNKALDISPDVVLSDVMMPVMNGIKMLDQLKNNPATSHIPVVLLSARFSVESQIEGLKYGADYYIAKPFNNEFLAAALHNLVVQRKRLFRSILKDKKETGVSPTPITITSHDELFLQKVIQIVEEKMIDNQFNIDVVADAMNMSRSPFYKKLKSLTALSPVEFVKEIRLKRSLQYLDAGEHNISFIAYEVGFKSAKYFSTCFKQRFNQTPSEYIKSNMKTTT